MNIENASNFLLENLKGRLENNGEDNIKVVLHGIRCEGAKWIQLTQDKIHCQFCEQGNEPKSYKSTEFHDQINKRQLFDKTVYRG
jgi:hypothetical protein